MAGAGGDMRKPRILVVDDQIGVEGDDRAFFLGQVGAAGRGSASYPFEFAFHPGTDGNGRNSVEAVTDAVLAGWPDSTSGCRWALVLLDVRFGAGERFGFTLLEALREHPSLGRDLPIVMLTSEDRYKRATADRLVADGFLPKFDEATRKPLLSREALFAKVLDHGLIPDLRVDESRLIGRSLPFMKMLRQGRAYARKVEGERGGAVLYGQSGTGKSELAAYIHQHGPFAKGPFIHWFADPANTELMKDELFGHWKGAHSEARDHRAGKVESAHGGTFFLDEVANLPAELQKAFLKVRKQYRPGWRLITRLGKFPTTPRDARPARESVITGAELDPATHDIGVKVDILTATNEPLEDSNVRQDKGFRDDLHNALGEPIHCPGLNERREDIPELFRHFVAKASGKAEDAFQIDDAVFAILSNRDWSVRGHVRDLDRIARHAAGRLRDFDTIHAHALPPDVLENRGGQVPPASTTPQPHPAIPIETVAQQTPTAQPEPAFTPGALARADIQHLRRRLELLGHFAEETRRIDPATGQPDRYQLTAIAAALLGSKVSPVNAKRVIRAILGDVLDTPKYLVPAYIRAGIDDLRTWVSGRPLLMQLYRYTKDEIKADEIGGNLNKPST